MPEQHEFVQKQESYEKVKDGIIFHCTTSQGKQVDIQLTVCTPHLIRFRMCPDDKLKKVKCLLEIKEDWPATAFDVSETPEAVSINAGAIRFEAQKDPWKYTIYDKASEIVLKENVRDMDCQDNYRALPIGFTTEGNKFCRSNETFSLLLEEAFYGFGEKFTRLNKLGQRIMGWNKNPYGVQTEEAYKNIPFFMSTRGYGIFVNTTQRVTYDMGSRSLMTFTVMVDDPRLDMFIIYGPKLRDVLARYEEITGWPSLPPKQAFGIECNPGEHSHAAMDNIMAIARKFRELDIPVDRFAFLINMLVHWSSRWEEEEITTEKNLAWTKTITKELGKLGIKTGLYVAPLLNLGSAMEKEAREKGYALTREDGSPYEICLGVRTEGERGKSEYSLAMVERDDAWRDRHNRVFYEPALMPDFTNPKTVKWWKGMIIQYMKAGCDSIIMSDFGEDVPADACYHNGRSGKEMHNIYQLLYQKASFEAVAEGTGHRGIINARNGTAGMQRYPICWSGDPNSEWEDMRNNIRGGLSIGLSGVPFWSCDNAGYNSSVGRDLTPDAPELWIRWSQFSLFQSNPRLHGMEPRRVPWTFGERAVDNFRKYAKLRYRLMPYIYSQAYKASKTGLPMMRAMVLEFQDDPNTYSMEDQYMFGDAFLVAPVYTPVNRRTVYLPKGKWFDYWTAREYRGPATLRIAPPLEVLPLYVRGDSIIPMGPDIAYVGEKPFDPITLDTWLVSEAECTIYDDDSNNEIVRCCAKREEGKIEVNVSASERTYVVKLNRTGTPASVKLNGVELPRVASAVELEMAEQGWYFDPTFVVYAKFRGLGSRSELVLRA